MNRPAGVTASAVIAIVVGIAALALGGLGVLLGSGDIAEELRTLGGPHVGMMLVRVALPYLCVTFGIIGLVMGIGLLRLKPWAPAFALALATLTAGSWYLYAFPQLMLPTSVRSAPLLPFGDQLSWIGLGVSVWWLVLFNLRSTRRAFAPAGAGEPHERPVGVAIVGALLLFGAFVSVDSLVQGEPVPLLSLQMIGPLAMTVHALFAAVQLALGVGVLRMNARARTLGVAWFAFVFLDTLVPALMPGGVLRAAATPDPLELFRPLLVATTALWLVLSGGAMLILARRRSAPPQH